MSDTPFRVMGIDPGSHIAGLAVVERGTCLSVRELAVRRELEGDDFLPSALFRFYCDVLEELVDWEVALMVVEKTQVMRNADTQKKLDYFEAAAMMAAGDYGCMVEQMGTSRARKLVFGDGRFAKQRIPAEVSRILKSRGQFLGVDFTEDEAEAIVFALAGELVLEYSP